MSETNTHKESKLEEQERRMEESYQKYNTSVRVTGSAKMEGNLIVKDLEEGRQLVIYEKPDEQKNINIDSSSSASRLDAGTISHIAKIKEDSYMIQTEKGRFKLNLNQPNPYLHIEVSTGEPEKMILPFREKITRVLEKFTGKKAA